MSRSTRGTVVFSHGKDSSANSYKIERLEPMVRELGWRTEAADDQDTNDPYVRCDRLVERVHPLSGPIVLWGSSLGGAISVFAAQRVPIVGLFLLAPAVYWPGHEDLDHRVSVPCVEIVHGWRDDVVPFELSMRFAKEHRASLHLLDDDHLLHAELEQVARLFRHFLTRVTAYHCGALST